MTGGVPTRWAVAAIVLAVSTAVARAEPLLVPGRMGYNALPPLRNPDPVIGEHLELELSAQTQASSPFAARDAAATPYFRVTVPIGGVGALEVDGVPLELFQVSSATQARLGARQRAGVAPGDLRVAARFQLADERRRSPALGVQVVVKTTTGKGLDALRFTNAPGYTFDLLAGKDLLTTPPLTLRALAKLGFLAWQVGEGRQDDAVDFGATLRARFASGVSLAAELRGYAGWREDDTPIALGFIAAIPAARWVEVRTSAAHGLTRDAPPVEARLGLVFYLGTPAFVRDP